MDFSWETATSAVVDSFRDAPDPRFRAIMESAVRHLHGFVREVKPTMAEWNAAIEFVTALGKTCTDTRQEVILFSDVLGVSMMVETLNGQQEGTESTVLGPFHLTESPARALGDSIDLMNGARPCVVSGRVLGSDGIPLPGAEIDVWQCNEEGFYDVQQPDVQPAGNGRGLFRTDPEGRYWFRSVVPSHYPIPTDGPVGALMEKANRHPFRPAHIHFIVRADGHEEVTTHTFVRNSAYVESDAVFAVKRSLLADFAVKRDEATAKRFGVAAPFTHAEVDFVLQKKP
ncbi:dioxygenase [Amycolatopsis rhabdoformis]|uniref:Dioxygenase n=1 Tax=Amycolatopsis rhabdoformis TaxID=1448059 RepID=A0ABZ1I6M3_9PSEU|nr:dioxygenase [Amycolatopsis rhabdoformis]WSE29975.1 dioxygenase [Amycolatopsis rhabdoformis]